MMEKEIAGYKKMNELAEESGIVILGGSEDQRIPLCELRQAFAVDAKMYNRSVTGLSVMDALRVYQQCVAPIAPETILLHIGEEDLDLFEKSRGIFDQKYCELIQYIKSLNKKCRIAVVSLRNYNQDPVVRELNRHLKYISDSEQCTYIDISNKKVWNPKSTMDAASFVSAIGFVRPLKYKRPLYDLARIVFCCEALAE